MLKKLYPDIYVNSLPDIPLAQLAEIPIKAFILDLDNTLTLWNSDVIDPAILEWLQIMQASGFKACILSNNGEKRIHTVAQKLNIPFIHRAGKPNPGAFLRAADLLETKPTETAVIGDQIFTDILGGNSAGLFTILVVPLDKKEFIGTKISRLGEKLVLGKLTKTRYPVNRAGR